MKHISILLADDHKLIRDGLKSIIESHGEFRIIAEADNGREAFKLCNSLTPDIVIMDVAMPGLNGVEATRQIVQQNPDIRVIALSMHANKQYIRGMFKAGAYGYLLKSNCAEELVEAIRTVNQNKKYISHHISDILIDDYIIGEEKEDIHLSEREKEILQLITEGKSSRQIGEILFLSSKTVDAHRKNIMDKLQLYSIPDLTKYAIRMGLTSLDN